MENKNNNKNKILHPTDSPFSWGIGPEFDGLTIRAVGTREEPYFVAKDVAKILGYADTQQAIRKNVDENCRFTLEETCYTAPVTKNIHPHLVLINSDGLTQLITKTRKVIPSDFSGYLLRFFDVKIETKVRYECKESETLGYLMKSYSFLQIECQKNFGSYFVDMYLPKYKIAIECDEHGHDDRCELYEKRRQRYIEDSVEGLKFVRFNPDSKDFSIFDVIGKINMLIMK